MLSPNFNHIDSIGFSVKGPYHIQENMPNQDAWKIRYTRFGVVGVVCDGFGSAPKSDFGAQLACKAVIEAFSIWTQNQKAPIETLIRLIHDLWGLYIAPHDKKDCATTCLFVMYLEGRIITGQLGDGLVLEEKLDRECLSVSPEKQHIFSNQTTGMGFARSLDEWRILDVSEKEVGAVLLATDGVSEDLVPWKRNELIQYLKTRYIPLSQKKRRRLIEKELEDWGTPNHLDDKTLMLIWKKPYKALLHSFRKNLTAILLLLMSVGFLLKFYTGTFDWWFNNYAVGVVYEVFWIFIVLFFFPDHRYAKKATLLIFGITSVLEFLQLWHPLFLEKLRAYFLGEILIGTTFSWWDFPHYAIGCMIGCLLIRRLLVHYHLESLKI